MFLLTSVEMNATLWLFFFFCSDTLNVVASEHRPFTIKQKAMGKDDFTKIPHGLPGIQDRMSVIWEKGVVRAAVWAPAGGQTFFIFFLSAVWGKKS